MNVTINIHKTHRQHTDGNANVATEGATVGECIADLTNQYPDIKPELFDENGRIKRTVEIYLNMESAYPDELAKVVKTGDEIHLTLLLAGG